MSLLSISFLVYAAAATLVGARIGSLLGPLVNGDRTRDEASKNYRPHRDQRGRYRRVIPVADSTHVPSVRDDVRGWRRWVPSLPSIQIPAKIERVDLRCRGRYG